MDRLKQVEEQIYLFRIFCGYFFYFFTFYRDVHLPVVGFEGFLSWHLATVDAWRPGDCAFFSIFFFLFDFYLNAFFFIVLYIFFGDVDDVTRKPSITQPVHLHFGIRQETNEGEWKNKNKENCNLTWILNFSKIFEKKKLRTNMADDKFLCIGRLDLSFRKNIFII